MEPPVSGLVDRDSERMHFSSQFNRCRDYDSLKNMRAQAGLAKDDDATLDD